MVIRHSYRALASRPLRDASLAVALAFLFLAPAAEAKKEPDAPHVYGAEPSWQDFRELAEMRIRNSLIDPDSAKISWTHGFRKTLWKPFLSSKIYGYVACGYVNSRNRMGGYAGTTLFMVVIDNGMVLYSDIGKSGASDLLTISCTTAMQNGTLPSLPGGPIDSDMPTASPVQATVSAPTPVTGFDFTTITVPDGAYVSAVTPGGTAERSGLKPGMVIASLNGISLKGMNSATTAQLLAGAGNEASLSVIGLGPVKIRKSDPARPAPAGATNLLPAGH